MKNWLMTILFLPVMIYGQDNAKLSYGLVKTLHHSESLSKTAAKSVALVLKGDKQKLITFVKENGGAVKYHIADMVAVRIPVNKLSELADLPYLIKAETNVHPVYFNDEVALAQTLTDTVHAGEGLLQQPYTGQGVIFGMIDSGIDPTHPDFQNNDGSTRILAFWDQRDTSSALTPYGYGKRYTWQDIDNGAMINYLDSVYGGHGSAVAGVGAGGGRVHPDIKGMAPEAHIIAVGIDPDVLDYLDRTPSMLQIVDGIDFIFKHADSLNMPAVINISLGGIEGSHDGRDLPTQMIDAMLEAKFGRALVTSAGNSAQTKHHIQFDVNGDTLFTWFESMYSNSEVCKRDSGAYMSFYGDSINVVNLKISIAAEDRSPCCTIVDETGFQPYLHSLGTIRTDTLWNGTTEVGIINTFVEKIEDIYAFFMEIESIHMDMLWRCSVTGNGKIDGWAGPLTARSCNSTYIFHPAIVGASSQIENYNNYVQPDNDQTIGTAYASSKNVVTVGAHAVRKNMLDVDSIQRSYFVTPLRRASFSSLGPSRDGRVKPDITAPGSRIVTTQASQVLADKASNARSTLYLGGQHAITDGTSFASPAVAGIVALYFEKYPNANFADVINAIVTSADQDTFMDSLPNNSYGYGRINAYQMLLTPPVPLGLDNTSQYMDALVYPNPSDGTFTVVTARTSESSYRVKVFNLLGQPVYDHQQNTPVFSINIQQNGTFIMQISNETGTVYSSKLVVH